MAEDELSSRDDKKTFVTPEVVPRVKNDRYFGSVCKYHTYH